MGVLDELAYGDPWAWYRPARHLARARKAVHVTAALAYARRHRRAFPITFVDVGARFGPTRPWQAAARAGTAALVLIEPDEVEADRLERAHPTARVLRTALGPVRGVGTLHVTEEPAVSSMLEPDPELVARLGVAPMYRVRRTVEVPMMTFDAACTEHGIDRVHFTKLDVQGFEYQVVEGFGRRLDDVLGIEVEVAFQPTYRDQRMIGDVNAQLVAAGFVLMDVRPLGVSAEAGVIEANAFYARRRVVDDDDRVRIAWWRLLLGVRSNSALRQAL